MFIDPFPYGNMNGIVDMAHLGLAGVCRVGPQVHEHIDAGMFHRLGLPGWLVADSTEAYVAAAVRLVDGHRERRALRLDLLERDAVQVFFQGDCAGANSYYFDEHGDVPLRASPTLETMWDANHFPLRDYAFTGGATAGSESSSSKVVQLLGGRRAG